MQAYETYKVGSATVSIYRDDDPPNPRTNYDCCAVMACWHSRYNLGDETGPQQLAEHVNSLLPDDASERFRPDDPAELINVAADQNVVMLPLYLYDHSGLSMNTGGFSSPWDSGQVGVIFCTRNTIRREWTGDDEAAIKYMKAVVAEYDQYLRGDVWGYVVETPDGVEDSCWGFYGLEYCKEQADSVAEHMAAEYDRGQEAALSYVYSFPIVA